MDTGMGVGFQKQGPVSIGVEARLGSILCRGNRVKLLDRAQRDGETGASRPLGVATTVGAARAAVGTPAVIGDKVLFTVHGMTRPG